jgi:hypothetical protein
MIGRAAVKCSGEADLQRQICFRDIKDVYSLFGNKMLKVALGRWENQAVFRLGGALNFTQCPKF